MKLWVDDIRPAPLGYYRCRSVKETIDIIVYCEASVEWDMIDSHTIELIDIDHDAGDYAWDGGDYIKLLDWLEETGRNYPYPYSQHEPSRGCKYEDYHSEKWMDRGKIKWISTVLVTLIQSELADIARIRFFIIGIENGRIGFLNITEKKPIFLRH